jgi:hypothetical protein
MAKQITPISSYLMCLAGATTALVLCLPAYIYGQNALTAADIAERCRESLSWQKSFSIRIHVVSIPLKGYSNQGPTERDFTLRYDANTSRGEWIGQVRTKDDPCLAYDFTKIMTGQHGIEFENYIGRNPENVKMFENSKDRLEEVLNSDTYGGHILGRMGGNNRMNIAMFLMSANDLFVRPDMQSINGLQCYVLEGTTRYGKATAWVASDKRYSPAKWIIQKSDGDLLGDKAMTGSRIMDFEVIEFEQHGTMFIPKRAKVTDSIQSPDGTKIIEQILYEISEVQLNPNFDALGSFKVNLPEGVRVLSIDSPGIKFVWQNSKVVPDVNGSICNVNNKAIDQKKK